MVPFWTPRGVIFGPKPVTILDFFNVGCVSVPFLVDFWVFFENSPKILPKGAKMGSFLASGGRFGGLQGQLLTKFWSARHQSINQSINKFINQPINQSITQSNQSKQSIKQSIHPIIQTSNCKKHINYLLSEPGGMREAIKSAAPVA